MGTQAMASSQESSKLPPLARQGSLYNLTLDEVQSQLGDPGKPLGSMNLDELLKNVWTAEASQSTIGMEIDSDNAVQGGDSIGAAPTLQRQASVQLSRALSKKTVDEVWRDIQQGDGESDRGERRRQERQPTLGEMTLEDFLLRAGVVAGATLDKKNAGPAIGVDLMVAPPQNLPEQAQWLQYQQQQQQVQLQEQNIMGLFMPSHSVQNAVVPCSGATTLMDAVYLENQLTISSPLVGALSDTQTPGRKRGPSGDMLEKTVERRHKRMIKNRESAARSRARKQAYTNELENKVSRLEEENEKLKRQKELEKALPSLPPAEPKYQLRRTSSAPF
ncbi:hypothetical protein Scep_013714 [Stephania cephalantha]|uniref:BZIP domain-containing protein n=1 Tax=Stephania cephalantha TaxID=152367 RepID=A0AAP0NZN9_9MAGN